MDKFYKFCGLHDLDVSVVEKNINRLQKLLAIEKFEDLLVPINSIDEVLESLLYKYTLNTAISIM